MPHVDQSGFVSYLYGTNPLFSVLLLATPSGVSAPNKVGAVFEDFLMLKFDIWLERFVRVLEVIVAILTILGML